MRFSTGICALFLVALLSPFTARDVVAQPQNAPTLQTYPSPPPANQEFDAEFGVVMHDDATGFWGRNPEYRIEGNVVNISFDITCAFICIDLSNPAFRTYSFKMPALPAGDYIVRFVFGSFDNPDVVLAEFALAVGGSETVQLPIDHSAYWLLGILIAVTAFVRLRVKPIHCKESR
jgi:hypothetical protein